MMWIDKLTEHCVGTDVSHPSGLIYHIRTDVIHRFLHNAQVIPSQSDVSCDNEY